MAPGKPNGAGLSFSEATKVEKLDSHTYRVNLRDSFCIGAVPNGGYTSSCMLGAASIHLSSRDQSDTLTAHFEYPNRTKSGPAIVVIEDVKLGRQLSTLHLTLWQGKLLPEAPWMDTSTSRRTVLAYTTHTNLCKFTGMSLPTGYETTPAAELPPLPDFEALRTRNSDDSWEESKHPSSPPGLFASLDNWRFYIPRLGPLSPGVLDVWIRMANEEQITQAALAYVVDSFPYNMHTFLAAPELRELLNAPPERSGDADVKDIRERNENRRQMWFPTVVLNMEAKTRLPEEGVEWLAVRVMSKQIKDGRFDLEAIVRDVDGELIALSHHLAMIVSIERNTGKKGDAGRASL